jgi:hypothetical protein
MPINDNLEAMAKQLYDYWFVQFDFPNEEGKPYKSNGGAMVWNEKLKRDIPQGWSDCILGDICDMYQPKTLGLNDLSEDSEYKVYGANGIIGHYSSYNHENSEIAMACRGNSCGTINRTSPKSWITGNAMVIKFRNKEIHNEYIKQALKYANVKGAISGSGQPQLTRENLSLLKMTQPNYAILEAFSKKVAAIVAMELEIEEQNDNLTKQRDELLPLLMNGQASVNYHLSASTSISFDISVLFLNFTNGNSLYRTISLDYQRFALPLHSKENTHGTIQEDKRHIQQRQRQGDKHARERFLAFFYKCTSTVQQAAFGNAWCYRGYKGKDISESK